MSQLARIAAASARPSPSSRSTVRNVTKTRTGENVQKNATQSTSRSRARRPGRLRGRAGQEQGEQEDALRERPVNLVTYGCVSADRIARSSSIALPISPGSIFSPRSIRSAVSRAAT